MIYKSPVTLLFVYAGLCGMDKPSCPRLEFDQTKFAVNSVQARQPQDQAAAFHPHVPLKSKGNYKKRKRGIELSYKCPECKEDFYKIHELREHLLGMHTSYRPYACNTPGCSYNTAHRNCLKVHLANKHKQDALEYWFFPLLLKKQ